MNKRMRNMILALSVAVNAMGGELMSSARSAAFSIDTVTITNSTLTVNGSMLPLRLDYSPSLWNDVGGMGGNVRITANEETVLEETGEGSFFWSPTIAGIYSISLTSSNGTTLSKTFTVVTATVTIEREGYNLCKLTASDGVSEIRYTTDGTDPTADSPLYTGPFEVPPSRLSFVRAATFVAGCPRGEIVFAHFNSVASSVSGAQTNCAIDNSGGTKKVGYDAVPLTYDTEWEGDASSSMELRIDGELFAVRTGSGEVAWTPEREGLITLTLKTINDAGGTLAEYSAQYDVVPRNVTITDGETPLNERYPGLCHWITNITVDANVESLWKQAELNPGNWISVDVDGTGKTVAYRSNTIGHNGSTVMSMAVEGPLEWSFKWKVSSEGNYDWLRWSLDGVEKSKISGTGNGWQEVQCAIPEGEHTVCWTYTKDSSGSSSDDCGWVAFDLPQQSTFEGCTGLKSVTISAGLKSWLRLSTLFPDAYDKLESVVLAGDFTEIPDGAFEGCAALRSIEIPAVVTKIGKSAFAGCTSLEAVHIPSGVVDIGRGAFDGCSGLTRVTIPDGVAIIGDSVFRGCSGLTRVTIPDGVTVIGDSAFRGCSGLTSLTIPDSVTNLGMRVAFNPGNWTRVEADAEGCTSAYRPDVTSSSVSSEMSLTVEGPLDWSFKWKTPVEGYDSMKVRIEYGYGGIAGVERRGTGGSWEEFQCQMTEGKNTISWTYIKRWYGAGSGDDYGCVAFDLPANAFSIFEGCTGLTSVTMPERFKPLFGETLNGCPISYYGFKIGKVCGGGWWGSPFVKHEIWENNEVGLYGDEYAFVPVTGSGFIKPIILYGDTPTAHLGRVSVWTDEQMFEKFVPSGVSPSKWEDHYDEWEHETSGAWYSWAKGIWPDNKIVDGRRWIVVPANEVCLWSGVTSFRVGIAGTREISDPILVVPSEEFEQNGLFAKLTPNDFIHGVTISGYENFEAWDEAEINWGEDWYQSSFASRMQTFEIENWRAVSAGRSMTFNVGVPSAGTLVVSSTDDDGDSPAMRDVFSITGSGIVSDTAIVKSNDYDSPDYCRNVTNFWKTSSASHIRRIEVNKATTLTFTSNTDEADCEFNRMYFFPKSGKSVAIDVGYIVHEDTDVFRYWGRDYVQGYVTGGGVYKSGESATLKAVSGEGQEFDRWEVRFGNLTLTEAQKRNPTLSFTVTDAMCGSMEDEEQIFLSAIWKPKYKVTVLPSIVGAGTVMGTGRYFEGETVTLSATAAEGCTFVKWSDGETAATRQIKVVAADVERVIYACFEAPNGVPIGSSYGPFIAGARVEFDVGLVGYTAKGLPSGLTYTTKTGIVSGSVKAEGVYDVTFSKKGEEDVLIQIVVRKAHEVSFDANGGMPKIQTIAQFSGDPFIFPQDPTLAGHEFMGWWTARDGGEKVTGNAVFNEGAYKHLYAHWTANTYRVAFDPNGGMGEMSAQTMTYDQEAQLSFGQFANMDLLFRGWATVAGGGVVYHDGATVKNLTAVADDVVTLYAVWQEKPAEMLACEDAFGGAGTVSLDANDNIVVTLTKDVSGTVEIPDNVGSVTIDLNGHDMVGDDGPAIRIVAGDGEGGATRLAIVDTSDGEKGQISGGGESAGIEVAEDAATGVKLDVEEGVGVFNGDGSEQPWWELCPVEATLVVGEYFRMTLAELGYDVPTDGTPYEVKALGLPAGLKLKYNAAVKDKKGKVVKKAKSEWWIEGVPTAAVDFFTNPPYLVITANGAKTTEPLPVEVLAQNVTELEDLALGQTLNEQFYLPGVTKGWTVSGLPTGLKYTAKLVTEKWKSGKKTMIVTNALPYSVYGKTTKAGLFTITAKRKAGAFYETMKYRVLVKPASVDTALFGEELTNITTMAYVPFEWDLTNDVAAVGGKVAKVAGLPAGLAFASATTYKDKKKTQVKQYGQTIVGTPTKPGTYVVTFTKNVKSGKTTVAKTAQILWTVVENDAELELGFNTAGGVIEGGTVGLKYGDLMAFSATDGATVTASGMPAGITLANLGDGSYAFRGFTTKAGTYLVTVKATLKGKTVTQRVALKVDALPAWAKGAFNGYVAGEDGATNGLATITVSSVGKISGKFYEGGTNWTFTAASYTGYDSAAPAYSVPVVAKYAYKATEIVKGKKKTVTKSVARNFTLRVGQDALGGVATLEEVGGGSTVHAWQNLWGQADYKALGKRLFSTKSGKKTLAYRTFTIKGTDDVGAEMGLTDAMSLSLKVTTAGVVTATMSFDTGKTSKGKAVIYKPTCSTVVIPLSAADAEEFEGEAILFFAPSSANGFPGFAGAAPF